jgi:hypothetical protein
VSTPSDRVLVSLPRGVARAYEKMEVAHLRFVAQGERDEVADAAASLHAPNHQPTKP